MAARKPKGYVGRNHETIGSDILSVVKVLRQPDAVLGPQQSAKLSRLDPNAWYPIEWLIELMEILEQRVGVYGLLQMGRELFRLSHQERVIQTARSARDIIYGLNDMYNFANRGEEIGGWKVLTFEAGKATVEKTTPHHCMMEQGIVSQALIAVSCPSVLAQPQCFRTGGESCIFVISSALIDERWYGPSVPKR